MSEETSEATRKEKRLKILTADEIDSIYSRPCFTDEERIEYFTLSQSEQELLEVFRSIKSQVYFILQLGYFKAKHLFFIFTINEVEDDFQYVLKQHFNSRQIEFFKGIDKQTRLKQQRLILKLYSYRICAKDERQELELKAQQLAIVYSKPVYILREIINYLTEQQIVLPGYSLIQDTVSQALIYEQNRLINIIHSRLQKDEIEAFKKLLEDSTGLYEITQLKREPRDFSLAEIKREIQRGEQLRFFYQIAQKLLREMGISNESIKYYASLVNYYSVNRLKQLNEWTVYIYLICFTYHRYQQLSDNLINCLIYRVRQYNDEAKNVAKERLYKCHVESNENLQKWEYIDKLARQFKLHLRRILITVEFTATISQDSLIEAVNFLKTAFEKSKSLKEFRTELFPIQCIPDSVTSYLYTYDSKGQKHFLPDRYEFLLYRLLRNGLEAGDIFCRDSIHFRSLEDDLIDDLL
jgi:hypothetical protein